MENILERQISIYNGWNDRYGTVIPLGKFLFSKKHKEEILHLRSMPHEQQKDIKAILPAATISGIFAPIRSVINLKAHSGLICLDLDSQDNKGIGWWLNIKKELSTLPQVAYIGVSVSGNGYFVIIPLAHPEHHRAHFEALKRDFARTGLTIDKSCRDVSRLRVLSYDPEPYINEFAICYQKEWYQPKPALSFHRIDNNVEAEVRDCCQQIQDRHIDLTANYDDWFEVGAALSSLGERGREYYHICSAQNVEKYKAAETERKFDNVLAYVESIHIGTFFYICQRYGIHFKNK